MEWCQAVVNSNMVVDFLNNGYFSLQLIIFQADTHLGQTNIVPIIKLVFIFTLNVVSVLIEWLQERLNLNKTCIYFDVIGLLENVGWYQDDWSMNGQVNLDALMFVFTFLDQICIDGSVFPELFQTLRLDLFKVFEVERLPMECLLNCSCQLIDERHHRNDVQRLLNSYHQIIWLSLEFLQLG